MDPHVMQGHNDPFEQAIDDALNSLPANLRAAIRSPDARPFPGESTVRAPDA
jgi:hypothetical protein